MAKQDVQTAYSTAKNDIASLLGFFQCELSKQPGALDWAVVGDLKKIRCDLIETLSFMSGIDPAAIEETLEESRS